MSPSHSLEEQMQQIDGQILRLISERARLYAQAEAEEGLAEFDGEAIANAVQDAEDFDLDEGLVEKVFKLVSLLCRKVDKD